MKAEQELRKVIRKFSKMAEKEMKEIVTIEQVLRVQKRKREKNRKG